MNDIALGLAWAKYLVNPSEDAIEEVLLALEGRPDLKGVITPEMVRKRLTDGIPELKQAHAQSAGGQAETLMQKLLTKGRR